MEKVLVEVYVPAIGKGYDVFLPGQITVQQAMNTLNGIFAKLNQEYFKNASQMLLCDRETGIIYNPEELIYKTRIVNGSKLLLI